MDKFISQFNLIITIVIFGIAFFFLKYYWNRVKEWRKFSTSHNFNFSPNDKNKLPKRFKYFDFLNIGFSPLATNNCIGVFNGITICLFDYQYNTNESAEETIKEFTLLVADKNITFESIDIRPANPSTQPTAMAGFVDVPFTDNKFNQNYEVKAGNKQFAYGMINTQIMDFLGNNPGLYIETRGTEVLFHRNRVLSMVEMEKILNDAENFFSLLPENL